MRLTREVAFQAGRPDLPVTLGCGGQCTRDVIAETRLAAEAGADFVLVLTPSYFHFAMNQEAIVSFFQEVRENALIITSIIEQSWLTEVISWRIPVRSQSLFTTSLESLPVLM